jgi:N-acylneuraminate cytidylyltransferase
LIEGKTVFAVICARGGSKGLPGKNIRDLAGKPLIAWTIEAAQASTLIDKVILTSDDTAIIDTARHFGCEAPFVRPAVLATDESSSDDVLVHALENAGEGYDLIVMLQPTSPLRTVEDIDGCIRKCIEAGANSCITFAESGKSPYIMFVADDQDVMCPLFEAEFYNRGHRRQDLPAAYSPNGAVYVAHIKSYLETRDFCAAGVIGYMMPGERSIDIDTELDFRIAEMIIKMRPSS